MTTDRRCLTAGALAVLLAATATVALEPGPQAMTITYNDGTTQSVQLDRPSSAISKIEFATGGSLSAPPAEQAISGEATTYPDRGHQVSVSCGEKSFASKVIAYKVGDPAPIRSYQDPQTALGPPDFIDDNTPGHEVSLGCGGSIVLEFERVRLVDEPGPDVHVFEAGAAIEPTRLEISPDGQRWTDIGRISGGTAAVDIHENAAPGQQFRFVRLTDVRSACGGDWPGADIDAVAAVSCVPVRR